MRTLSALGLLVALAVGGPGLVAAAPVTVEYPSTECPDTGDEGLQQCIDGVDPGSTVILNTEIIEEGASITKSLTLRGIDRDIMPVLTGIGIGSPATGSVRITLEDVRLRFRALRGSPAAADTLLRSGTSMSEGRRSPSTRGESTSRRTSPPRSPSRTASSAATRKTRSPRCPCSPRTRRVRSIFA